MQTDAARRGSTARDAGLDTAARTHGARGFACALSKRVIAAGLFHIVLSRIIRSESLTAGEGTVRLDGVEHAVRPGTIVHIPPGVVHGAKGRMRVLVVGIPDISDDDLFYPEAEASLAE